MTALTGSIAATANPGPALYAVIETAALALGWTLEDTVVIGGNTHKVLKSAAAGNARSLDFFIDVNYPTTGITGGFRMAPFEGYNAATDVGTRGPFGHVSVTTIDATTYSRYGATGSALETNWTNTATATNLSQPLSVSTFGYWISITRNRIIVMIATTPIVLYSGFFLPNAAHTAHAGAALFPLVVCAVTVGLTSSSTAAISSVNAALTRMPKAVSAMNWATSVFIPAGAPQLGNFASGQAGVANSEFTNDMKIVPLPILFNIASIPASSSTPIPSNVGELDGLSAGWVSSTASRGDTISDGTDTWVVTTPGNNWATFIEMV